MVLQVVYQWVSIPNHTSKFSKYECSTQLHLEDLKCEQTNCQDSNGPIAVKDSFLSTFFPYSVKGNYWKRQWLVQPLFQPAGILLQKKRFFSVSAHHSPSPSHLRRLTDRDGRFLFLIATAVALPGGNSVLLWIPPCYSRKGVKWPVLRLRFNVSCEKSEKHMLQLNWPRVSTWSK